MTALDDVRERLKVKPLTWLVTGAAGFIGSNLVETLLRLDQAVVGMDNFITGSADNLDGVRKRPGFTFVEHNVTEYIGLDGPLDWVLHFASPASPLDYLEDTGWLTARSWLAHGIHFTDGDIARLGRHGVGVCHCPTSNMLLASGRCRTTRMLRSSSRPTPIPTRSCGSRLRRRRCPSRN